MEILFFLCISGRSLPTTNSKTFLASCHCSQRGGKTTFLLLTLFFWGGVGGGNVEATEIHRINRE